MSKRHITRLAAIMVNKGIETVVVSPGSRNAPVVILFNANKNLNLLSVADERSAAFFALGLALKTNKTVALLCTSGSAALNYAPAIAEAYYQKVSLLVLTADRPAEWIDQGDSQTMRQTNVYGNYIRKSYTLPEQIRSNTEEWYFDRMVNEAIDRTKYPAAGPVQINIPLSEPLYSLEIEEEQPRTRSITFLPGKTKLTNTELDDFSLIWNQATSKMILVGQSQINPQLGILLNQLANDPSIIILTETISNLSDERFISSIDRTLAQVTPAENDIYRPKILLTLGGAVVSKKVKAMLRDMNPPYHWHINHDTDDFHFDTYMSLTATIAMKPEDFLDQLASRSNPVESTYSSLWQDANKRSTNKHEMYLNEIPFSDMKAYKVIFDSIPSASAVHLANSTPVRYAQLFDHKNNITFYSNRGTSGIDGCISTAAGFALNHDGFTVVITGDIGFFYDSNALWNLNLDKNFRVILINNGGGNIFRIIDGPSNFDVLEPFIETSHHFEARGIANNFNIVYFKATNEDELHEMLPLFFHSQPNNRPALLEIITEPELSAKILKEYFKYLRS